MLAPGSTVVTGSVAHGHGGAPLVAAMALCPRAGSVRLARWLYFAPADRDDSLRRFLEASDLWPEVVAPPDEGEAGATAFCPRCHAQYVRPDGTCSDCSGVALVRRRPLRWGHSSVGAVREPPLRYPYVIS